MRPNINPSHSCHSSPVRFSENTTPKATKRMKSKIKSIRERSDKPRAGRRALSHAPDAWKRWPIANPSAAAPRPMRTMRVPCFHQEPTLVSAWYAPTPKSTSPLKITARTKAAERWRKTNGSRGTRWPINVATVTITELRMMSWLDTGRRWRSSSRIVSTHLSRFAVIVATTSSSNGPENPLLRYSSVTSRHSRSVHHEPPLPRRRVEPRRNHDLLRLR